MTKIKFDDREAYELKEFYKRELEKTLEHLEHIQNVLSKFDGVNQRIEINVNSSTGVSDGSKMQTSGMVTGSAKAVRPTRGRPPKSATPTTQSAAKKRGPKSKWGSFILRRLRQTQEPLTYNELITQAKASSVKGVKSRSAESIRQSVLNSAFRLRTQQDEVGTFGLPGSREKFVGLISWFDSNGKVKNEYLNKAKKKRGSGTSSKTKSGKRKVKRAPDAPVTRTAGVSSRPAVKNSANANKKSATSTTKKKQTKRTAAKRTGKKPGPKPKAARSVRTTQKRKVKRKPVAERGRKKSNGLPASAKKKTIPTKSVKTKK